MKGSPTEKPRVSKDEVKNKTRGTPIVCYCSSNEQIIALENEAVEIITKRLDGLKLTSRCDSFSLKTGDAEAVEFGRTISVRDVTLPPLPAAKKGWLW
jgi:hypothetical protein